MVDTQRLPARAEVLRSTLAPGLLLLTALVAAGLRQGGFYPDAQRILVVLIGGALLVGQLTHPISVSLRAASPALLLAGWALLLGGLRWHVADGLRFALLVAGVLAAVHVGRLLDRATRELLRTGIVAVALLVAGLGWIGVAAHQGRWAQPGQGVWRASSTITYPNGTAALLTIAALVIIGALVRDVGSWRLRVELAAVLIGLGATLSRAGLLALAAGVVVLAVLLGPRRVVRAGWSAGLGGAVGLVALLPSLPTGSPSRPVIAALGLLAGLGLAALAPRPMWSRRARRGLVLLAVLGAGALVVGAGHLGPSLRALADGRISLASADRSEALHATWNLAVHHLVAGTGPGLGRLTWVDPHGGVAIFQYSHNEYLQLLADFGLVGAALFLATIIAFGRVLFRARRDAPDHEQWAAAVAVTIAVAISFAFDFIGHIPVIPLTAAALIGTALPVRPDER